MNSEHLQAETICALQFVENPKCIYLPISDEDCCAMWIIVTQKLESAANTKTDDENGTYTELRTEIFTSQTD